MITKDPTTRSESRYGQRGEGTLPLTDLVRQLRSDLIYLLRQEVALAKTETSEKIGRMTRNSAYLAIGGMIAYAGLLILLLAGTVGLYLGLVAAGLTHATAGWLAPLIVGVLVAAVGYGFVQKGLSTIRNEPVVPERTAQSLHEDKEWAKEKVRS